MQYTFFIVLKIYIVLKKKFVGSTHLRYGKSYEAWYGKLQTFKTDLIVGLVIQNLLYVDTD